MNERQRWGQLVKAAMEAQGMQGKDLARATGWSASVVSELLAGERKTIPPDVVREIWRVLRVPLRTQVQALGYLDPVEAEPGIAYAIPEKSARAALLDALVGASDDDVATITAIAVLVPKSGLRRGTGVAQSDERSSTNRSA